MDKDKLLGKAKIGLMTQMNSVFISTILFSLKFRWDERIPTACTNGTDLRFNPQFFLDMTADERIGVLAHEAWHVAYQHMCRLQGRDPNIWNQACDHVINLMLLSKGYTLPEGRLADSQFKDMSAEQVYDHLVQHPEDQAPQFQPDFESGGAEGSEQQQATTQAIEDILVKAATQSKMQGDDPGTIPGEIEVFLDKLLNPKLPWHTILNRYLHAMAPEDYSYRKLNRRFLPDHYLPGLWSESMAEIAVAVDTSGSVTDDQFAAFLTEIHTIQQQLNPEKLTVIDFDTSIKAVHTLERGDSVAQVKFHGRGGTRINPVLDWADEHKPTVMLIFTDGYFHKYTHDPGIPVIWVIHSNPGFTYDFGKVIEYPL